MTLTFGLPLDMVMICSHAKFQGQWSVGSENGVETNRRTDIRMDGGDCFSSFDSVVDRYVQ